MGKIFIIAVLLAVTSCAGAGSDSFTSSIVSKPLFMSNLPEGDDEYSVGFRHGCQTQVASIGSGFNRLNTFNYDALRGIESPDYYKGFRTGIIYCTYYVDDDPL